MSWQDQLNGGSPSWLLERDEPGVRYLALRDLAEADPRELKVPGRPRTATGRLRPC